MCVFLEPLDHHLCRDDHLWERDIAAHQSEMVNQGFNALFYDLVSYFDSVQIFKLPASECLILRNRFEVLRAEEDVVHLIEGVHQVLGARDHHSVFSLQLDKQVKQLYVDRKERNMGRKSNRIHNQLHNRLGLLKVD